ncbi:MAG: YgeY family selenium metabolism-linked hydrolase [Anaerolineales bacterium]|nr:YgeY family selenium metabolism-linked hydrolase [Anaerolineales bacterium]
MNTERLLAFTQSLVRQRSLSGEEGAVIQLVVAEMRALGFDHVWVDANGSAIGVVEGAQAGPTLLLDAHCDTVGIAAGVPWQDDPFGAQVAGTRLYGRGTSDMKGALAGMVQAAGSVNRATLAGRVAVSATVMEEVLEGVALRTVMDAVRPAMVIIGEATELRVNHGGRGRAEIHLEAIGRPAHSSTPHLGVNAVHLMLAAVQAVEATPLPSDPLLGPALLALTDIISDPYPAYSVTPSRCRVTYDRRLLPGETSTGVLAALQALPALKQVNAKLAEGAHDSYTGVTLRSEKFFPAWKLAADHPLVAGAMAGLRATGQDPQLGAYRFCTNAAYSAGSAGVPTIGYGPSAEGMAHIIDEYIELDQLNGAALGYAAIIAGLLTR